MIESHEARISPAKVFVRSTSAFYTVGDEAKVTVAFSKAILTAGAGGNVSSVLVTHAISNVIGRAAALSVLPKVTGGLNCQRRR